MTTATAGVSPTGLPQRRERSAASAPNTSTTSSTSSPDGTRVHTRLYRIPRRSVADWVALGVLLAAACVIFFVNLTVSGYANEFYSAAAQAGSVDWEAFLWGSLDSGNAITVDKPPAAIWLMALSIRLLGLSSFSILLPQAIMGVATTYVLYATVRRYWGNRAGVMAGAMFCLTPVVALMFKFNNPDALLVLLMTTAAYSVLRALEYAPNKAGNRRRTLWMVLAGVLIGFGFLTKQMQVFLVLPGFALAFLIASPSGFLRRIVDGLAAVAALIVSAGWWVLLTVLVPADSRPYIGGSQTNSFIELTFGYNGLGRITGSEEGSVVPGGGGGAGGNGGGMWGQTGWGRLFAAEYGTQIAWLAPLAFLGIIIGFVVIGRAARIDLRRASIVVFGGWLVITWITFSFMAGIFHQYYTVALAPAVAVLTSICVTGLWIARHTWWSRILSPVAVLGMAIWSYQLIGRSTWQPWLKWAVLAVGIVAAATLAAAAVIDSHWMAVAGIVLAAISIMAGSTAWTMYTAVSAHTGSIVTAGPSVTSAAGFGGGNGGPGGGGFGGGGFGGGGFGGGNQGPGASQGTDGNAGGNPGGNAGGNQGPAGNGGGFRGNGGSDGGTGGTTGGSGGTGEGNTGFGRGGFDGAGGAGGLLGGGQTSSKVVALLEENADSYRWVAATSGSQNAAGYQLASQNPVMAIGGFNGSDPAPTLTQFKQYVAQGLIHYYVAGGGMGGSQMGGSNASSQIASWVSEHYAATTVDSVTIYDLTQPQI